MGEKIAQASLIISTLRDAGYKNTSYAVAELVDNSIEAEAKNIDICIESGEQLVNQTTSERIQKIAVFDDGIGMEKDILSKCLSFGWGTRLNNGTGLGKFGFGLKGASISQARRIEIYSWQENQTPNFIYLDIDEIIEQDTQELPDSELKELSSDVRQFIPENMPSSGTLIIWTKLDRLNPKRADTLIDHLNNQCCRIFRHYMDDDDVLGRRTNVTVKKFTENGFQVDKDVQLLANDPSYLLTPNNVPDKKDEATNVKTDEVEIIALDPNNQEQKVKIILTIAKPEIQSLGGSTAIGRHYAKNNGLSFVRHGRELELDLKGFYSQSEPRNRWIGIEIQFPPQLDTYFNVPNNKQSVRDFYNFSEDELEYYNETAKNDPGSLDGKRYKLLLDCHTTIKRFISKAEGIVKARGKGSRTEMLDENVESTSQKASKKIKEDEGTKEAKSTIVAATKTEEEKKKELVETYMKSDTSLTVEEATHLADYHLVNLVEVVESEWPGNTFLDVQYRGNAAVAIVNRSHKFYDLFYDHLQTVSDTKGIEALKLMILALTRTEDVMTASGEIKEDQFQKLRDEWGKYLNKLLPLVS